jgi:hypothetical protein
MMRRPVPARASGTTRLVMVALAEDGGAGQPVESDQGGCAEQHAALALSVFVLLRPSGGEQYDDEGQRGGEQPAGDSGQRPQSRCSRCRSRRSRRPSS